MYFKTLKNGGFGPPKKPLFLKSKKNILKFLNFFELSLAQKFFSTQGSASPMNVRRRAAKAEGCPPKKNIKYIYKNIYNNIYI